MNVEHDDVEVPPLQLDEGEVGHQGATQEEEGVHRRQRVQHRLGPKAQIAKKKLKKRQNC